MPVMCLTCALSGIGTLVSAANNVLNQEHVRTEPYVRAFSVGSVGFGNAVRLEFVWPLTNQACAKRQS